MERRKGEGEGNLSSDSKIAHTAPLQQPLSAHSPSWASLILTQYTSGTDSRHRGEEALTSVLFIHAYQVLFCCKGVWK